MFPLGNPLSPTSMLGSLAALLTGPVEDECWPDTRENRFFILCWNVGIIRLSGRGLGCVSGGIAPSAQNKLLRPVRWLVVMDKFLNVLITYREIW